MIECSNGSSRSFGQAGGTVSASSLSASNNTGEQVIFLERGLYNASGQLVNSLAGGASTVTIPASLSAGTYTMRYRLTNGSRNDSSECQLSIVISNDIGTGTGNSAVDLDCLRTNWLNGTPRIVCGAAASDHVAQLFQDDGSALTVDPSLINFSSFGAPSGVNVSIVGHNGNGQYTFRIDPSAATCFSESTGSISI